MPRMSFESCTSGSSKGMSGGRKGRVPVAIGLDGAVNLGVRGEASHEKSAVEATVSCEQVPVYGRRGQVGRATSTCWSPALKKMVALASVDPRHEAPGTPLEIEWSVEGERGRVDAAVVALQRIPVAQSYNVALVDTTGNHATVFVAPGQPAAFSSCQTRVRVRWEASLISVNRAGLSL